jgi:DNA-binding XRE family transcriptional regulator
MEDKIREYRRIHGLTQKKLAEQLGVLKSRLEEEIKQPAPMYSQSLRLELFRSILL